MSRLVESLKIRAVAARSEGNATALGDALHFEDAAERIEALEAALKRAHVHLATESVRGFSTLKNDIGFSALMNDIEALINSTARP